MTILIRAAEKIWRGKRQRRESSMEPAGKNFRVDRIATIASAMAATFVAGYREDR